MDDKELKSLTSFELLDLRYRINQEIETYADREKTQCYKVFIIYSGTEYFIDKKNAIKALIDNMEYIKDYQDDEFPDEISLKIVMLTQAEIEKCEDYIPEIKDTNG